MVDVAERRSEETGSRREEDVKGEAHKQGAALKRTEERFFQSESRSLG